MVGEKISEKDFNWKQTILDTYVEVKKNEEKFTNIDKKQEEIQTTHKEHCDKEEKDWVKFKNIICEKVDNSKCPEKETIAAIKANGAAKASEIKILTDSVTGYTTSVTKVLSEAEGERKAWKKLKIRTAYIFGIVSGITSVTTKIIGLW